MGACVGVKPRDGIGGCAIRMEQNLFDALVREGLCIWIACEETVRSERQFLFGIGDNLGV
jgi:hypothetical protein